MEGRLGSNLTVQGPGSPVPAEARGEQAGPLSSSISDRNALEADHLASRAYNVTSDVSENNPFQRKPLIRRTPRDRRYSDSDLRNKDIISLPTHEIKNSDPTRRLEQKEVRPVIWDVKHSEIEDKNTNCTQNLEKEFPTTSSAVYTKSNDARNNKKGHHTSRENQPRQLKQSNVSQYWLSSKDPLSNRFEVLSDNSEDIDITEVETPRTNVNKPPPIFVAGVKYRLLTKLLEEVVSEEYKLKIIANNYIKIQPLFPETHSVMVKKLKEKGTEFHTYKPKQERSFKVVLKNMHPFIDLDELRNEINGYGHKVTNISNIKQRITKRPLPIFFVELEPNNNNKDIYKITSLLQCNIKFEAPRKKREIPQCINCQRYGHTKGFCYRRPRCVKCAGDHVTANCSRKQRSDDVKCVLCHGNHPANYKGCDVYKRLLSNVFPSYWKGEPHQNQNITQQKITSSRVNLGKTFSEVVTIPQSHYIPTNPGTRSGNLPLYQTNNDMQELKSMMKTLMENISYMLNILITLVAESPY